MKFNKIITSFFSIAAASLLVAACGSNEQTAIDETGKVDSSPGLVFKIEAEEYQTVPTKGVTRATGQDAQPQEIDLGNGLVAELTIEPDTLQPAPKTRATISDGHYRIYVVNSSNQRLTGPHQSIAGTVSGGVFTPDANRLMLLDHGTYTFVCINDAVTDNGTSLEVKHDAVNAMIGTTTVAITQPRQEISFTMRHMMARIRYQVTSYTSAPTNATFSMGTDAGPFGGETFNIKGEKISQAYKSYSFSNIPLTPTAAVQNSAIVKKYKSLTNYMYFPDGFDTGIIQSGGIQGNLHGKTFSISPTSWFLNRTTVQRNHSYVFNFTIKSKTPLLLFQDGTVGYLGDKGTRTPIGVVAREKTATQHGIAVALKDVDNLAYAYTTPYDWTKMNIQHNTTHYTDFEDVANDLAGYDWTYEASGSVDGRIKANFSADYTPFYKAARYNPGIGVTGANVGKWYLPAMGEWYLAFKLFGRWDGVISHPLNLDLAAINKAFTDAGGDALKIQGYWNSSEYEGMMRPTFYVNPPSIQLGLNATHNLSHHIRPFVHF
jgi:hypothetical protein